MSAGQRRAGGSRASVRSSRVVRASAALRDWNLRMMEDAEDGTRRGTRWGRGTCAFLPGVVGIGALGSAIASGAMAANLAVLNGQSFTLLSNYVSGSGFGAIVDTPNVENSSGTVTNPPNARLGFSSAGLNGFCGLVTENLGVTSVTVAITAGAPVFNPASPPGTWPTTTDVTATDLYLETADLGAVGSSTLTNATLGASADTVTVHQKLLSSSAFNGLQTKGMFGLAADGNGTTGSGTVTLQGLNTKAMDAELTGLITLPNLHIKVGGTC